MNQIVTKNFVLIRQKYYTTIPQKGRRIVVDIYLDASCLCVRHHYSPFRGIVVYFFPFSIPVKIKSVYCQTLLKCMV